MKTIITPASSKKLNLSELLHYKDLFLILAYRDIKVRYAQTFLGLLWALLQPLATLLIFTLIFGGAIKVDTDGIPYPVFALAGMSAWSYFSFVMAQSGNSIIAAGEMVKKIYFPRLIIPLSKAVVAFVDFFVALVLLLLLMLYHNIAVGWHLVYLPLFVLLTVIASLGVGIWLSALSIRYRDFQHAVPFMVQIGLYATPVAYPVSMIPEKWQLVYHLNPMTAIIEGYRYAFFGVGHFQSATYLSIGIAILLFITGIIYFKRMEKTIADLV